MNPHPPSTTKNVTTPELILDRAEHLMLKNGYNGVAVDAIINACGVSKGTFFYHFKTKDALALAMVERFIKRRGFAIKSLMEDCAARSDNDFDTLIYFLEDFASLKPQNDRGCLLAAFSYQPLCESAEIKTLYQNAVDGWQSFFRPYIERAFQQQETPSTISVDTFSKMMFCLMEGTFIVEKIHGKQEMQAQFQCLASLLRGCGS